MMQRRVIIIVFFFRLILSSIDDKIITYDASILIIIIDVTFFASVHFLTHLEVARPLVKRISSIKWYLNKVDLKVQQVDRIVQ